MVRPRGSHQWYTIIPSTYVVGSTESSCQFGTGSAGGLRDFASRCARCSVNSIIGRSIFHETLEVQFALSLDRSSEACASLRKYSTGQSNNHVAGHQARCG